MRAARWKTRSQPSKARTSERARECAVDEFAADAVEPALVAVVHERAHAMAAVDERANEVGADVPGSAGDRDLHARTLPNFCDASAQTCFSGACAGSRARRRPNSPSRNCRSRRGLTGASRRRSCRRCARGAGSFLARIAAASTWLGAVLKSFSACKKKTGTCACSTAASSRSRKQRRVVPGHRGPSEVERGAQARHRPFSGKSASMPPKPATADGDVVARDPRLAAQPLDRRNHVLVFPHRAPLSRPSTCWSSEQLASMPSCQ